jgi:hypothetical protein
MPGNYDASAGVEPDIVERQATENAREVNMDSWARGD